MKPVMHILRGWQRCAVSAVALVITSGAVAGSAMAAESLEPPRQDWNVTVGMGTMVEPSYLGADNHRVTAVPVLSVEYKDDFFASTQDGVGYNYINRGGWKFGPIGRYVDSRDENDKDFFHIGGPRTQALRGLGNVPGTVELGGFVEYESDSKSWDSTVELRQGINGHKGMVADFSSEYTHDIHENFYRGDPPMIVTIGPRATVVDAMYNKSYFEVNADQSAASGLPQYTPGGGLLSYGLNSSLTVPLSESVMTTFVANYSRLGGDAADSPLVDQRGSADQASFGLFLTYGFGYNE
jgi:outer membrane scaffolding protein for murein synthesis (MipA/OmpV family)